MTLKQRKVKKLRKKEIKNRNPNKKLNKKRKLQQMEEKLNVFSYKSIQFH